MKKREKRVAKRNKNNSKVLWIIGIVILIVIAIFFIISSSQKDPGSDKKTEDIVPSNQQCLTIRLEISEADINTNMLKITRLSGEGDLSKINIIVNGNIIKNLAASDIKEGATRIFIIDINSGDKIEIAPVLKDGTVCAISNTKII